jgi:hypothetical protein
MKAENSAHNTKHSKFVQGAGWVKQVVLTSYLSYRRPSLPRTHPPTQPPKKDLSLIAVTSAKQTTKLGQDPTQKHKHSKQNN